MEYSEFHEAFAASLKEALGSEVELEQQKAKKVNQELDALVIRYPDSPVSPTIYIDDRYALYQQGYSLERLVASTVAAIEEARAHAPNVSISDLTPEAARENLYCALVNREQNEELLAITPHEVLEDLAIIPRYRINDEASFIVSRQAAQTMQLTSEEVLEFARRNTERDTYQCQSMVEVLRESLLSQGVPEEFIDEAMALDQCPMYVLTNSQKVDGAVAMMSASAMEEAYQQIKESNPDMEKLYILGSSRHELILIPDTRVSYIDELKQLHEDVQAQEVDPKDRLTEHVYEYDGRTRSISIADEHERAREAENILTEAMTRSHGRSHF